MTTDTTSYEPRYLAGILFFNRRDFFEAHEIWEELWHVSTPPERRYYQALIQAAVALYHFGNGNLRGAVRLYHSSRNYLQPYLPIYLGLNVQAFCDQMQECFSAAAIATPEPPPETKLDESKIPTLTLNPEPETWPDPDALLPPDEDEAAH